MALLGFGFAGRNFHAPLIASVPRLDLCAVASGDPAKVGADLSQVEVVADAMALAVAPDIDLVVVATPNETHAPLARAALAAGKHVVIDKPFTLDLAEARDLVALAERQGVLLSVFHNRRWDSDFLTVRQVIADGAIGEVTHLESHIDRFRPAVRDRWRERSGPGSGVWFDLGPHLIDQTLQLFGLPDQVQADLACQRTGAQTDDWAHVVLGYGERRVVLHAGMLVAGGTHRFVAHGTAGSLVKHAADRQEAQLLAGMRPGDPGWGSDPDDLVVHDGSGGERRMPAIPGDQRCYYQGIAAALLGGAPNPVTPLQALVVMAVVEAAITSARERRAVGLPLTAAERSGWR